MQQHRRLDFSQFLRMILRTHCGATLLLCATIFIFTAHCDVIETSYLSYPSEEDLIHNNEVGTQSAEGNTKQQSSNKLLSRRASINSNGNLASGAANLDARLETTLNAIRTSIPSVTESLESDIATRNRDRVILATSNFLGMVFGIAKATGGNVNWNEVSTGNKIQVFAQILYGYGYWGPFALEYEESRLKCNRYDLEKAVEEFRFLEDSNTVADLGAPVAQYYATEFNHKIKEKLYCMIKARGGNQDALELDAYIDLYTQLLDEKLQQ